MEDRVAFIVRELRARFPSVGITATLTAANSLLTCPALTVHEGSPRECPLGPCTGGAHVHTTDSHRRLPPPPQPSLDSPLASPASESVADASLADGSAPGMSSAWQRHVTAVLDLAVELQSGGGSLKARERSPAGVVALVEGALALWQRRHGAAGDGAASPAAVLRAGHGRGLAGEGCPPPSPCRPHRASGVVGGSVGLPHRSAPCGDGARAGAGLSCDATPSVLSVDATPTELPLGPAPEGDPLLVEQVESAARLAEELCYGVYHDLYERCVLAGRDGDSEDHGGARCSWEQTPSDDADIPAPLCSLVLECSPVVGAGAGSGKAGDGCGEAQNGWAPPLYFVMGCSWEQWEYLQHGPLACRCDPFPSEEPAAEQQLWRERHCSLRLLHPGLDSLRQKGVESLERMAGGQGNGISGEDATEDGSASVDNTTTVEYEFDEGVVVLRSLLGLAMRIWGESDAHLVAQIRNVEDTKPYQTFHSDVFWANFPQNIPPRPHRGGCAPLRGCHLPTPLLPGEYAETDGGSSGGGGV